MNLDTIGKLYDIDNTDPENPIVTELTGWHVNTTQKLSGLDEYLVTPTTPRRVFAGMTTYCYTFTSENQAKTLLSWNNTDKQFNPEWEPELPPVPHQVTRRQALTVVSLGGYLPQIEAALAAIEDPTQKTVAEIFWKESLHFERDNPVLNQLAGAIGMTQDDLDNLFRQAVSL